MSEISSAPDVSQLEVPIDAWTEPFWQAAAEGELRLVRCADCRRYRWPPGPFCPHCQSQRTEWTPAGPARIYSFTIVRETAPEGAAPVVHAPALVEFPQADGVRLMAAIVDAPLEAIRVGAELTLAWSPAANAKIPVFRLAGKST
jgi:uncharacterized OB-fold protein